MMTRGRLQNLKTMVTVQEIHSLPTLVKWAIHRDSGEQLDPINQVYADFPVGAMDKEGFIWTGRRWVR